MTPARIQLRATDGVRLHALCWRAATPSAPPVLLLHGMGDHAAVWQGIAPRLAATRDVYALDLRGHGRSGHASADSYSVSRMAEDVLAAADGCRLTRPLLVGHSLGAGVALHAVDAAPGRFGRLALIDYALEIAPASLKLVRAVLAMMHATYESVAQYADILKRRHLLACPHLLEAIAGAALQRVDAGHQPRFDPVVLHALGEREPVALTRERLARLALPVLVVRGALSAMVSKDNARELAEACRTADSAVVPLAGHSPQIDNPEGLWKVLQAWLDAPQEDMRPVALVQEDLAMQWA